jgi:uncharacterized protein YjbJ (UPF0337 family)
MRRATRAGWPSLNWERIQANWQQYQDSVRRRWAKLTPQELAGIAGNRTALAAMIASAYGVSASAAQMQLESWQGRQDEPPR